MCVSKDHTNSPPNFYSLTLFCLFVWDSVAFFSSCCCMVWFGLVWLFVGGGLFFRGFVCLWGFSYFVLLKCPRISEAS